MASEFTECWLHGVLFLLSDGVTECWLYQVLESEEGSEPAHEGYAAKGNRAGS